MARFLQAPQQQVIPMYQPLNLEFYSGILNKAQQDLERSTAIKASAIEKLYDIPFSSKEDADAVVGRVQELLKGATDADFVSPSKVTNAVMKANAEVMPGIQAAKAKAQATDMYDKMRIQYGPNAWMGTDPRSIGIMQGGKYADPSTFKAVGIDASELDKVFLASQLSELTKQGEPTYSASKLPGYYQERQTTGMSDADREATYRPGTAKAIQLAEEQLKSMPQVLEIFGGDREKALEQLQMRNYQTTGAYKQTIDTRLVDNKNYLNAYQRAQMNALTPSAIETPGRPLYDIALGTEAEVTNTEFEKLKQGITNPESVAGERGLFWNIASTLGWDRTADAVESIIGIPNKMGLDYKVPDINRNNRTVEDVKKESTKIINSYIKEYPELYKETKLRVLAKNKIGVEGYRANKEKIDNEIAVEFIDGIKPIATSLRMMRNELRAFSSEELPKLYSDMMVKLNEGLPLREIKGNVLGDEIDSDKLFTDKEKLNTALKDASVVINPVEGRIELTVPGEDSRYAINTDNLADPVRQHMDYVKALNQEYIKVIKSGKTPSKELLEAIRGWTDDLYRNISITYGK